MTKKKSYLISALLFVAFLFFSSCLLPYAFTVSQSEGSHPTIKPYAESQYMLVDGVWIHYRSLVPLDPHPQGKVLLVHGLGGSTYSFDRMIDVLKKEGYIIVAVDLPGFGYSGRPEKFDHSQTSRAKLLWSLLSDLDRNSSISEFSAMPWHLVGHSMGGGTVAAMAVADPYRSASLTLIAGALEDRQSILNTLVNFPPFARWTQIYLERSLLTEEHVTKILEEAYGRVPTSKEVSAYLVPLEISGTARSLTNFAKTSESIPLSVVGTLDIPVSGIWGELDTIVPLEKSRVIGKYLPHMRLYVIGGSAHIPMETHPEKTNFALIEFLSENQR